MEQNNNAWVYFHLLHLLFGPFWSPEDGKSQSCPSVKLQNMFVFTLTGEDWYAAPPTLNSTREL